MGISAFLPQTRLSPLIIPTTPCIFYTIDTLQNSKKFPNDEPLYPTSPQGTGKGRAPVFVEYGMLQPTAMVPGGLPKEEDPPGAGHTPGEAPSAILQDIAQNAG